MHVWHSEPLRESCDRVCSAKEGRCHCVRDEAEGLYCIAMTQLETYSFVWLPRPCPHNTSASQRLHAFTQRSRMPDSLPLSSPVMKAKGRFMRLTSKLKPPAAIPRPEPAESSTLPNAFTNRDQREAALRERGLLPPKDNSQQERERNARLVAAAAFRRPPPAEAAPASIEKSAAQMIREEWQQKNADAGANEPLPPASPP